MVGGDIPGKGGDGTAGKPFLLKCLVKASRQHLDTLQTFVRSQPEQVGEQDSLLCSLGSAVLCMRTKSSSIKRCRDISSAEQRQHPLIFTSTTMVYCNISGVVHHAPVQ